MTDNNHRFVNVIDASGRLNAQLRDKGIPVVSVGVGTKPDGNSVLYVYSPTRRAATRAALLVGMQPNGLWETLEVIVQVTGWPRAAGAAEREAT